MKIAAGAIVFDMDGLLVDSEPVWCEVEGDFVRARGGAWTPELARACIGQGLANTLRVMGDTFGFETDVERDGALLRDAFHARVGDLVLKPGARELIEEACAARVPLALGSSTATRIVLAVLERFALRGCFGAVVTGDDVTHPKPAPDIFLGCASRLRVDAAACVVLEDSVAGVTAARAAGMRAIAVPESDPGDRYAHADAVVKDLFEARALLRFSQ